MDFIPVNEPVFNGNEAKYLLECIRSGWISSEGPFVQKFEEKFANEIGCKYGIAVTNGTAALDVAIEALGISKGDEVIIPSFTIISCVLQVIRSGAKPVFVDSCDKTWNMDVDKIEEKINKNTKAILAVHTYGLPVNLNPVISLCERYNLKLIEDTAEQIGQNYYKKKCGSLSDISTFSFYPNKHITTGEGGMILTNNSEIAERCRELRNLCFEKDKRFFHNSLGWNLRMTNLQAAIGVAQLEQLNTFIKKKRWIGRQYNSLLKNIEGINLPLEKVQYADNIYWVYGIVLDESYGSASEVIKSMAKEGIGCRPFFFPMHQQPVVNKFGYGVNEKYPVAERISEQGFYIPSGLGISLEQIEKVVFKLKKVLGIEQ